MIWIVIALVLLATVIPIAIPVLNAKPPRSTSEDYDLAVFTDQMKELERDQARGLINAEEYKAARTEIGRRILAAQRVEGGATKTAAAGRGNTITAAAVLLLIPLIAAPLYVWRGNPDLIGDRVVAQPVPTAQRDPTQQAGLVESVTRLKARLEAAPEDFDGWLLLGRSYMVTQQPLLAIDAYAKAIALRPDDTTVRSFLGEAIVFSADGTVTEMARAAFTMAIQADPKDPAARFYLAIADAQAGNVQAAFDSWLALAADTPVDAPWRPGLIQQLRAAASIRQGGHPQITPDGFDLGGVAAQDARDHQFLQARLGRAEAFAQVQLIAHADDAGFRFDFHDQNIAVPGIPRLQGGLFDERDSQQRNLDAFDDHGSPHVCLRRRGDGFDYRAGGRGEQYAPQI